MIQVFTIFVFLFFINSLFGIAVFQRPLENTEQLNYDTMISFHYCNNYIHCNVLIASVMVIQLMCSIQAFRGRNLPSVMNDGIILMYATFTLTIVFGVSFAIVNARPPRMKELFQCNCSHYKQSGYCFLDVHTKSTSYDHFSKQKHT